MDEKEVIDLVEGVKQRFPNAHLIWLKDVCSFLNIKLVPDNKDPGFVGRYRTLCGILAITLYFVIYLIPTLE